MPNRSRLSISTTPGVAATLAAAGGGASQIKINVHRRLLETMDLAHAEPEGAYARVLVSLAGGLDALWTLGSYGSNGKSIDTVSK